jgi:hypothetical protein
MRFQHLYRRGMHHHRRVYPGKRAALEHQDFSARVSDFLRRRTDHTHSQPCVIGYFRCGDSRAGGHCRDHVVAARVAYFRQAVVFCADGDVQWPISGPGNECRWQIANAALHVESGVGQSLRQPRARLLFLKSKFRICVDSVAQLKQVLLRLPKALLSPRLWIHDASAVIHARTAA